MRLKAAGRASPSGTDSSIVTAQVFRLKAEGYKNISQSANQAIRDLLSFYHLWFNSRLNCPKSCVITQGLSLKAFSLQAICLSDYPQQ